MILTLLHVTLLLSSIEPKKVSSHHTCFPTEQPEANPIKFQILVPMKNPALQI